MPCFLHTLESIVDNLRLAEPLAPSPLPYATIAGLFPPPPPPSHKEQILEFVADCARSGKGAPLPAALALAGALLAIFVLYGAVRSHEEYVGHDLGNLPRHGVVVKARVTEQMRVHKSSQPENDDIPEIEVEECSNIPHIIHLDEPAHKTSQPLKRPETEALVEENSGDSATAEDTLMRESHDEWCSHIYLSLIANDGGQNEAKEIDARIEENLRERMEQETAIEKNFMERMEMEAQIENDLDLTMSPARNQAELDACSSRPSQAGQPACRFRRRTQHTVPQVKHMVEVDLTEMGKDASCCKENIQELEEEEHRDVPATMNISDSSDISDCTDMSDITYISDGMDTVDILDKWGILDMLDIQEPKTSN